MADGHSTLDERTRLARRLPEEIASEGAIEVVDEPFADSEIVELRGQVAIFGHFRQRGVSEEPVGWVESS